MPEDAATLELSDLRNACLAAVRSANAGQIASLVTDDIVVVHGDGRCVRGRDELKADFRKAFEYLRIDQRVVDPEIVIRDNWAVEIAKVESSLTPIRGGEVARVVTTTLVALRRQSDGAWKVAGSSD